MELQALREDEIAKIYKYKLMYSIIKYEKQSEDFKQLTKEKYENALNLNRSSFAEDMYGEIIEYLDKEKEKIEKIKEANHQIIIMTANEIIGNLKADIDLLSDDSEKAKFLFEYIVKTIKHNDISYKYNISIPFGQDYPFEFANGIPYDTEYEGLLVTRYGLSDDIANLMTYLGKRLDLDIKTNICEYNGNGYTINSINIDGKISYMDLTSVITNRKDISDACLVNRSTMVMYGGYNVDSLGNYIGFTGEGITRNLDYEKEYNFEKVFELEKKFLPTISYVENDIYKK